MRFSLDPLLAGVLEFQVWYGFASSVHFEARKANVQMSVVIGAVAALWKLFCNLLICDETSLGPKLLKEFEQRRKGRTIEITSKRAPPRGTRSAQRHRANINAVSVVVVIVRVEFFVRGVARVPKFDSALGLSPWTEFFIPGLQNLNESAGRLRAQVNFRIALAKGS